MVRVVPCLLVALAAAPIGAQPAGTVQYRSPAGVEYRALVDTGNVARAERALAAAPRDVPRYIALGVAQAGARQMREAVATFTRALAVAPNDPMLLRWRGHRYLSIRELDRAMADLTRGYGIDSTNYGILYHLGVLRFVRGDFHAAADAFARAQRRAPDAGELAGATDWLWMSLQRAGRAAEATAMLARRPDSLATTNAYARRLRLYRGELSPEAYFTPADTGDTDVATLGYGLGNWYLLRGDTTRARAQFARAIASRGWPAFGFIAAEAELARMTADSAYHAVQARGAGVMGVDQYTSRHVFEDLPDGGRIVLERNDARDTADVATIRAHLREIAAQFARGDFAAPFLVHAQTVPGTATMAARRSAITYTAVERPRGAELRIRTRDREALAAVHAFLAFQRSDHRAAGHEAHGGHKAP